MELEKLKQKIFEIRSKAGLMGGNVKLNVYDEAEHNISAHISLENWDSEISIRRDFEPIKDHRQKAYARAKKITDGLETVITHVGVLHETAHWELPFNSGKGCPYNIYYCDQITEAVKSMLPKDKVSHTSYVVGAFGDLIVNTRCKEYNGDFSGVVLDWDNQGLLTKSQGMTGFTPFCEAFVKLNMYLWGDNLDKSLLKRHYLNRASVDNAVNQVIKDLLLEKNIKDTSPLFDKKNWKIMAGLFAKDLADLLTIPPIERLSAFSSNQSEEKKVSSDGKENKEPAKNGIEEQMYTSEGKEQIALQRYSSGEKQSTNFSSYEQLNALYQRLSGEIPVKVEAITREFSQRVAPLNYRAFDQEKDNPARIKVSKLILGEEGISFGYERDPLVVESRSKTQRKSFPDFNMVVIDTSGTMTLAPDGSVNVGKISFIPWGDNSRYHHALVGFYGSENFLQRQGIAQYIHHGLALFSNETKIEESDFYHLEELKKKALSPQWGGTILDAKKLRGSIRNRESFVLSISDGEIENWNSERREFESLVKNNNYAHIQIGKETDFSKDLASWNCPVFYVTGGKDLSRLMIDVTQGVYQKFTRL